MSSYDSMWWLNLAAYIPTTLVLIAGIVLALATWSRNRTASLLVLIACLLLALIQFGQPILMRSMVENQSISRMSVARMISVMSLGWTFVRAVALGLLVAAAFVGRSERRPY